MGKATIAFIQHAGHAHAIEYRFWCSHCMAETEHDMHVNGDWEYYTCRHCRKQSSYRVR